MQKIIEQDLGGSEEQAEKEAKYTWIEGEEAWYFCTIYRDLFKVKFTGKHWLIGNKWGRRKIYQYQYLESSHKHFESKRNEISHGEESKFYTTKEEAFKRGILCITNILNDANKTYGEDMKRITEFYSKSL